MYLRPLQNGTFAFAPSLFLSPAKQTKSTIKRCRHRQRVGSSSCSFLYRFFMNKLKESLLHYNTMKDIYQTEKNLLKDLFPDQKQCTSFNLPISHSCCTVLRCTGVVAPSLTPPSRIFSAEIMSHRLLRSTTVESIPHPVTEPDHERAVHQ